MTQEYSQSGVEWVVDASGSPPALLQDLSLLQAFCDRIIQHFALNVIGNPQWHQFPGHRGVTGLYLLSESHLSCHTYPESGLLTLNLYCCKPVEGLDWEQEIQQTFQAEVVLLRKLTRGLNAVSPVSCSGGSP